MTPVTEPAPARQRPFQILVPLIAFGSTLLALELGLAIFHPVPFSIASNMYFDDDPYTGNRLKPAGHVLAADVIAEGLTPILGRMNALR